MKKLKEYIGIIVIVLVILGIAFFWFEIRPMKIRGGCMAEAQQKAVGEYENSPLCSNNFLTIFKQTFPEYANLDNATLSDKITSKLSSPE